MNSRRLWTKCGNSQFNHRAIYFQQVTSAATILPEMTFCRAPKLFKTKPPHLSVAIAAPAFGSITRPYVVGEAKLAVAVIAVAAVLMAAKVYMACPEL
ncbi:MAG: hypothetical protein RL761_196, partial [Pseudomonadota bacterium]